MKLVKTFSLALLAVAVGCTDLGSVGDDDNRCRASGHELAVFSPLVADEVAVGIETTGPVEGDGFARQPITVGQHLIRAGIRHRGVIGGSDGNEHGIGRGSHWVAVVGNG